MALEASDRNTDTTPPAEGVRLPNGMIKLPNGIILDKDGKPCRACNTKSAFSAFAAQATHKQSKTTTSPAATQGATTTNKNPAVECPPDVAQLGRSSWTLLHSIAAQYPETPSNAQQSDLVSFVRLFSRLYPCWVCADDFQAYIARDAPRVASRDEFGQWLCRAHNNVNVKLGKPVFDCARWEERWRTGPPDGSCD